MKNYYLSLISAIILLIPFSVISQEEITLDFSTKKFTDSTVGRDFKKGSLYRLKINNINLNLYKISISTKDTTVITELKTPTFEDISFSNLSTLVGSFNDQITLIKPESLGTFQQKMGTSMQNIKYLPIPCKFILEDIKTGTVKLQENYIDKLDELNEKFRKLRSKINKERWGLYGEESVAKSVDYKEVLDTVENMNNSLNEISLLLSLEIKNYESLLNGREESSSCLEDNKELKSAVTEFIKILKETKTKMEEFKKTLTPEKIDELIKSFFFLTNNMTYESMPFQHIGDKSKLTINIQPKSPDYNLQSYSTSLFIPQFKNDTFWSIGASFFYSSLKDEEFSIIGTTNDEETTYIVIKEDQDDYEIGIATLMRYGWLYKNFGSHLSFGPGINIGKQIRPRILVGGGLSIGDNHRFSVDVGGIVGYVDKQSNIINVNQEYTEIPESTTVTRIDVGYFVSIGYFFTL